MTFTLTEKQAAANKLLASDARHVLLVGGSRSGKTFVLCRAIAARAMKAAGSRHLIVRYRFNHAKASIWHDTWPKMMSLCWPDVVTRQDKADWFIEFPNGSQTWIAGIDEKERTEKVLGLEFATILLNEVSQISLSARTILMTRLAQNCGLALKSYSDCNPPMATHWAHRLFVEKRDPSPPYAPLKDRDAFAWLQMNPRDNLNNLPPAYIEELERLPAREKLRFLEGRWGAAGENVLWSYEGIETHRRGEYPTLQRIVVGVDPSGASGPDDKRSDCIGIVVVGLGIDGRAYVLEDASCKAAPHVWGNIVAQAYIRHDADAVIVEKNFGGAMAKDIIQAAAAQNQTRIFVKEVTATRGKVVRAEPIAQLYEQNKVSHVGRFDQLEDELTAYTTAGYMGDRSPDRADAMIWALSELFPRVLQAEHRKTWERPEPVRSVRSWSSADRAGKTDWERPEAVTGPRTWRGRP